MAAEALIIIRHLSYRWFSECRSFPVWSKSTPPKNGWVPKEVCEILCVKLPLSTYDSPDSPVPWNLSKIAIDHAVNAGPWVFGCLLAWKYLSSSVAVFVRGISTDFPQPLSSKFVLDLHRHQMEWRFRLHKLTTVTLENVPFYLTLPHWHRHTVTPYCRQHFWNSKVHCTGGTKELLFFFFESRIKLYKSRHEVTVNSTYERSMPAWLP